MSATTMPTRRRRWPLQLARCAAAAVFLIVCWLTPAAAICGEVDFEYDASGRLKRVVLPNSATRHYTLDAAGNRVQEQVVAGAGRLQFTVQSASVAESSTTLNLAVTRTGAANGAIAVSYEGVSGTAGAGTDFSGANGTLSWNNADASNRTVAITIVNDAAIESNETFIVRLRDPTGGAALGAGAQVSITITDDDTVTFSISGVTVTEQAGAVARFTVSRQTSGPQSYAVSYATANGSAVANTDYTPRSGTLSFGPGELSKTFDVPLLDDDVYEGIETFTASLAGATNGAQIGTATATATVQDGDPAPRFSITEVFVDEAAGSVSIGVILTGKTALSHSVTYSSGGGTATAAVDYTAVSGTLTFSWPTQMVKNFQLFITNDATFEPNETVVLTLSNPTNGATLEVPASTATIVDNSFPGIVAFGTGGLTTFGESFGVWFQVLGRVAMGSRWGATSTVCSAIDGTAMAGSDYVVTPQTFNFPAYPTMDNAALCTVTILEDSIDENDETFTIVLSTPTNGGQLGTPESGTPYALTFTIGDNDAPPGQPPAAPIMETPCVTPNWCELPGEINVSWSSVTGTTQYQMERSTYNFSTGQMGPFSLYLQTTATNVWIPLNDRNVFGDSYRVRACNAFGCGAYSESANYTVQLGGGLGAGRESQKESRQ